MIVENKKKKPYEQKKQEREAVREKERTQGKRTQDKRATLQKPLARYIVLEVIAVVVLGGFFFVFFIGNSNKDTPTNENDFEKIAALSLIDYEGNNVALEKFRGEPLVINSWAVWCPFCREELADFAALQKEFGDRVMIIAIDRQESVEKVRGFTDELGITNDMLFLLDSSDSFYKSIGGFSMPETIFMNSAGEIVIHKRGPMELAEMREHVNKILE